ncbi:MAG: 4Fe-4S binding protein [Muribaculaceae bacterium]|nr:4Fe-4S binding protein [Muribaculaceae bacterium]
MNTSVSNPHPTFSSRRCTACRRCIHACPQKAIGCVGFLWHRHAKPDFSRCIGCNRCVSACPRQCFTAAAGSRAQ